ncbi:hypothetical protein, variant [Verruconis gallopava]|uniref:Uncharacterized protein n=1 Tax=Verruconis gallopava TaxID=253628 RepID=A0A0D1Z495_9PEZI|nr:hypothetical protein, variant [Verruconis gallopava]KIW07792.1 hypothetical protein, variant [Verruconis gallopava]
MRSGKTSEINADKGTIYSRLPEISTTLLSTQIPPIHRIKCPRAQCRTTCRGHVDPRARPVNMHVGRRAVFNRTGFKQRDVCSLTRLQPPSECLKNKQGNVIKKIGASWTCRSFDRF